MEIPDLKHMVMFPSQHWKKKTQLARLKKKSQWLRAVSSLCAQPNESGISPWHWATAAHCLLKDFGNIVQKCIHNERSYLDINKPIPLETGKYLLKTEHNTKMYSCITHTQAVLMENLHKPHCCVNHSRCCWLSPPAVWLVRQSVSMVTAITS